ncbi:MAG TPA: nucleotide exchange factor GrpE, partial [Tepidisphaeraceae bacterium]|nr:nucleotide exchange factor GrpE [Tepidisphaeraceae bacterium]
MRMETDNEQPTEREADAEIDEDLAKLRKERDELFDRLMRTAAEFKNSQRRLEQEKEQALQFANSNLVKALLPVIDNFERGLAVDAEKTDVAAVLKGMEIILHQLTKLLDHQHVKTISPNPGDPFDPTRHEAL